MKRFTSEDPLGLGGGSRNIYGYVDQIPTNGNDPDGKYWFKSSDQFEYYGEWCGPGWTGGRWEEYDPANDSHYKKPVDDLDAFCEEHDKCYYNCRHLCDSANEKICKLQCNRTLAHETLISGDIIFHPAGLPIYLDFGLTDIVGGD